MEVLHAFSITRFQVINKELRKIPVKSDVILVFRETIKRLIWIALSEKKIMLHDEPKNRFFHLQRWKNFKAYVSQRVTRSKYENKNQFRLHHRYEHDVHFCFHTHESKFGCRTFG